MAAARRYDVARMSLNLFALALTRYLTVPSMSARATARPDAPLTLGPGQAAAPIIHTPGTTVRYPPL
jgi:hypothetical protein